MARAPIRWAAVALLGLNLPAVSLAAPRDADRRLDPRQVSPLPSQIRRVEPAVVGLHVNLAIPIEKFLAGKDELLAPRPWVGLYTEPGDGGVVVAGMSPLSPARAAGMRAGDGSSSSTDGRWRAGKTSIASCGGRRWSRTCG